MVYVGWKGDFYVDSNECEYTEGIHDHILDLFFFFLTTLTLCNGCVYGEINKRARHCVELRSEVINHFMQRQYYVLTRARRLLPSSYQSRYLVNKASGK